MLILLAIGLIVSGLGGGSGALRLGMGALLLLTVCIKFAQARAETRRIEAALLTAVTDAAAQLKVQSDRAHYERYLRSSGAF
ncbi:hypothetical protein [Cryobacterium sp. N22]|uniref:hypothetical protein n=1 Tax=Cryobacterium sp. N22 TaxID=2048290 RepID=UPI0011B09957|nr:hypothetical protein [Cryobacterium sp. N22]